MTIGSLPYNTKLVDPVMFDVSIYPVAVLLTATGVQYETAAENKTVTFKDIFTLETDTYFPYLKGKLAWVYVNLSFEFKGDNTYATVTYKAEIKKHDVSSWTKVSASSDPTYQTDGVYEGKRFEGYIPIDTVDYAPFDIRVQFKSGDASHGKIYAQLKNDTVIRIVGSRETR